MKKTILILLGMILLVGIISAGVSDLNSKESEYVTTYSYTVLDETNLVYELLDNEGNTFKVTIYDDSCRETPIYEYFDVEMPCIDPYSETKCYTRDRRIIGTKDACYEEVIPYVQDYYKQRDKLRAVSTIEEYQDENLEDKIIDETGDIKDKK